jgi:hypothetical protein
MRLGLLMDICVLKKVSQTKVEVLINFTSTNEFAAERITISDYGISCISRIATDYGGVEIVQGMIPYLAPEIRLLQRTQATTASDMCVSGSVSLMDTAGKLNTTWKVGISTCLEF